VRLARSIRPALALVVATTLAAAVGGCSAGSSKEAANTVTLVTHDSFDLPKSLVASFEKRSGIKLEVSTSGDAGQLASKLELSQGDPLGDASYGIDNTFAAAVQKSGVFAGGMKAVDTGYVCVNVDDAWFAAHHQAPPKGLGDLVEPAYKNELVTPGATTSSPGMAFLLATIGTYGDGWQAYWRKLMANGAKIDSGWTEAFDKDYSYSGGDRPIVVSYNTDPSYTVKHGRSSTHALLNTCFRQTEYAGVLAGAQHPTQARQVVDWLLSPAVQKALPGSMYVYPTARGVSLPASWKRFAPVPRKPIRVPAAEIASRRRAWTSAWSDIVSG